MADTPEKTDKPASAPKVSKGAEDIRARLEDGREKKGLPPSYWENFKKAMDSGHKARKLRDQQELAYSTPEHKKDILPILGARLKEFGERLALAPLGPLGEIIYQSRRADPGKKMRPFKDAALTMGASLAGNFGIVGSLLANKLRNQRTFDADPVEHAEKTYQNFLLVSKGFKVYDKNFDELNDQHKKLTQDFTRVGKTLSEHIKEVADNFNLFEKRYHEQEKQLLDMRTGVAKIEKASNEVAGVVSEVSKYLQTMASFKESVDRRIEGIDVSQNQLHSEFDSLRNLHINTDKEVNQIGKTVESHQTWLMRLDKYMHDTHTVYNKQFGDIEDRLKALEENGGSDGGGLGGGLLGKTGNLLKRVGPVAGRIGSLLPQGRAAKALGFATSIAATTLFATAAMGGPKGEKKEGPQEDGGFDLKDWFQENIFGHKITGLSDQAKPKGAGTQDNQSWLSKLFNLGKGKPVTADVSLDRRDVEKEKSQFLQFGQLPKGFEFLPGYLGRMGSAGAVAAQGAVPLGDMGGGSQGGQFGPGNGVSDASREAMGYGTGREANQGREGVYGMPLQPSLGGDQFGSAIPNHMRRRMAEGAVTPEGQRVDRSQFDAELKNPEVRAALAARAQIEVGNQPAGQQKWMESVMNRAAARGKTLMDAVNNSDGYYPKSDNGRFESLRRHGPVLQRWDKMIDSVHKDGTNLARGATGNESGNVQSSGAPIVSSGGGERYVLENKDKNWRPKFVDIDPSAPKVASTEPTKTEQKPVAGEVAERVTPTDQVKRPNYMRGTITMDGTKYNYGTGAPYADGSDMRGGSVPYGTHDIKSGLHYGNNPRFFGNSFRVKDMFDPKWGRDRSHILFHSARDLDRMYSAGCFAVSPKEWPAFKEKMMKMMKTHGELQVHVSKDGNAYVFPKGKPPPEIAKEVPPSVVPQTADQVIQKTMLDPSKDEKMRQQFAENGVPPRPVPVKPDLKVGDDGPTRETPEDAAKASGEFSPADFKDYIEPELNKMRPQDTSWQDAMRRADKQAEEIEAQGVKDDPERMPTEPDVVVPTPELKMPTAAPSFQDKEPIKDIGVQKTDIEPMSPEDAKEPTYQAAPTQQTTDNSGGSGGGGNSGRGTPNMRNGFESRAPGPGEAGMGSFGRCFV